MEGILCLWLMGLFSGGLFWRTFSTHFRYNESRHPLSGQMDRPLYIRVLVDKKASTKPSKLKTNHSILTFGTFSPAFKHLTAS